MILIVTGTGAFNSGMSRRLQLHRAVARESTGSMPSIDSGALLVRACNVERGCRLNRAVEVCRAQTERIRQLEQDALQLPSASCS